MDAAKQRTVVYPRGRGQQRQMFLPPGGDNPSYAIASAQQCKRGRFSLLYREQERALRSRPIVRPRPTAGLGSPVHGVWAIGPPPPRTPRLYFDSTVLRITVLRIHPLATSTDCPAASDGGEGSWVVIPLPVVHPLPWSFCDVSGAPPPATSIDQLGPGIGREQHRGPAGDPPLHARADLTPIMLVTGTYLGKMENLDWDLGIDTLDTGMLFPGN